MRLTGTNNKQPTESATAFFQRWDVVVVPYPLTNDSVAGDSMGGRRRPALVVSREDLAREYGLYWLLMITSAQHVPQSSDIAIEDWQAAGLPAPALIRTTKIMTISRPQILRHIGALAAGDQMRATLELSRFIG